MTVNARGLLPCGHPAEVDGDHYIEDQCFECGWTTPYRRQASIVNEAATARAKNETELVNIAKNIPDANMENGSGMNYEELLKLNEAAIRLKLRCMREETQRDRLQEIDEEKE